MLRYSSEEIRFGLKNGSREVLFYLARRFFQTSRRWLRTKGFRDADTPMIFSDALVRLMRETQHKQFPSHTDIRELFSNVLRNYVRELRQETAHANETDAESERLEVIARCFTIMDGFQQQLLSGHYADRINFEELASRCGYGTAVIAEAELDKAFFMLEQVVDARLTLSVQPDSPVTGISARTADRYITGGLTGSELADFEDRLQQDGEYAQRINFRRSIIQGIRQASDDLLAKEIAAATGYRKSLLPFGLKLLLGFVFIIAAVLMGWSYLGSDSGSHRAVLSFRWLNKVGSIITLNKDRTSEGERVAAEKSTEGASIETIVSVSGDSLQSPDRAGEDTLTQETMADLSESDIVVRKDVLLQTATITPVILESGKEEKKNASLADATARALDPSAGLPLVEEVDRRVDVELWSSPVNYRGYRRVGNDLSLYGFESLEGVGFYRLSDRVFVRSGSELYELFPTEQYQSYQPVRDPDLLERCR
ncbi:MAG: hypothetical protein RL021_916 [Bacteroidota bacterium]